MDDALFIRKMLVMSIMLLPQSVKLKHNISDIMTKMFFKNRYALIYFPPINHYFVT